MKLDKKALAEAVRKTAKLRIEDVGGRKERPAETVASCLNRGYNTLGSPEGIEYILKHAIRYYQEAAEANVAENAERWKAMSQQATSVIRMIRAMIGEMFGPVIESEEATLLRGPEAKHDGEAILEALQKIADCRDRLPAAPTATGGR